MAARGRNQCRGTTLVELMVVILIVGILAAVAIPIIRGQIDSAKWAEGRAIMSMIAMGLRTRIVEVNDDIDDLSAVSLSDMSFAPGDLSGTYFIDDNFSWAGRYTSNGNILVYTITAMAPAGITSPKKVQLKYDRSVSPTMQWIIDSGP